MAEVLDLGTYRWYLVHMLGELVVRFIYLHVWRGVMLDMQVLQLFSVK